MKTFKKPIKLEEHKRGFECMEKYTVLGMCTLNTVHKIIFPNLIYINFKQSHSNSQKSLWSNAGENVSFSVITFPTFSLPSKSVFSPTSLSRFIWLAMSRRSGETRTHPSL